MNFRTPATIASVALVILSSSPIIAQQPPSGRLAVPAGALSAPIVRSIDVQYAGTSTVSKEKILANMRTRVGRPYSEQVVEEDIRNLYATGNVSNVRIFGEPVTDGVKVIVVLQSKAQVTEVRLQGVTQVKESRIRKEISAKPGDSLNEAAVQQDKLKIVKYYADKGFSEVDVQSKVEVNEKLGTAHVTFIVNEGGKTIIRSVRYEGNSAITEKDLNKVVKTKPKSLLNVFTSGAGRLNPELLEADVAAIRDLYQSRGYVDATVSRPRIDRDDGKVDVVFIINEGAQYHVGKVTYSGAKVFTADEITRNAKVKTGEIFSPQSVRADVKSMQDLYGSRGYIDFQAGANTTPAAGKAMDVTFTIEEGVQSYLEHINISGNTRTKDKVIRREVALAPGDLFNTVRVDASKARLENLNYFYTERDPGPNRHPLRLYPSDTLVPGRKDLNIEVEEKRTGSFNFGAGFSSIDNLLGFAEITQGNFDITRWPYFTGGGQKFRLRVQYGTQRKDFILSLTEPYFMDREISVGGEVFYREASFVSSIYDERRYGFDLTARKRLGEFLTGRIGYTLQDIGIFKVAADASQTIKDEEGSRVESKVSGGLTYDTRDSIFLTRRGERVDLSAYVAGGFLGGKTDIYGFDLEGSKYVLLPYDTIFTINGEIAGVNTWAGGDRVPIFDRLFLGGSNNLRGFKFRDVGPKDENGEPIGGKSLWRVTAEFTAPVVDKVRAAVFYDIGSVGSGAYDFSGSVNSDVGVGVRLDLPIGPVRIDYGIPLQKDQFTSGSGRFNFNIGYQF
jgi:outer membrane protein insertion porin family